MIELVCFNVFVLFMWLNTNVFYEYIKYISFLKNLLLINQYENFCQDNEAILYSDFIRTFKPFFFIKLITCPFCLGFWIILIQYFIFNFNFFFVFILLMSTYKIFFKISKI